MYFYDWITFMLKYCYCFLCFVSMGPYGSQGPGTLGSGTKGPGTKGPGTKGPGT